MTTSIFRYTLIQLLFLLLPISVWAAQDGATLDPSTVSSQQPSLQTQTPPLTAAKKKGGYVPLDKVAAVINSSVLTQNQVNETLQLIKQQLQATGQPLPSDAVLRKKALDQAIGEVLQLQVAQRAKMTVSDADVSRAIEEIAKQNHLTPDQLKDVLQKQGINYAQYRAQIHDQILMRQVQQQALGPKMHVSVSDAEVQAYAEKMSFPRDPGFQVHLEDLLIPVAEDATPEVITAARQQTNELLKKAIADGDHSLSKLAEGHIKYNDLGLRVMNDLPDPFKKAMISKNWKMGITSEPIRAPNGFHILRLLQMNGKSKTTMDSEVKQMLLQQKIQQEVEKWVQELRKTSYIKIM